MNYEQFLQQLDFELSKAQPALYGTIWLSDNSWAMCENDEWKRHQPPKIPKHLMN